LNRTRDAILALLQAPDILLAVPEARRKQMQEAIGRIWHRCSVATCCSLHNPPTFQGDLVRLTDAIHPGQAIRLACVVVPEHERVCVLYLKVRLQVIANLVALVLHKAGSCGRCRSSGRIWRSGWPPTWRAGSTRNRMPTLRCPRHTLATTHRCTWAPADLTAELQHIAVHWCR
jgi:hypothetical protein